MDLTSSSKWLLRLPLLCVVAVTIVFTLGPDVVGKSNLLDALAHASAYAAITVGALVWPSTRPSSILGDVTRAVIVIAFGAVMELAQKSVGRDPQIGDVGANALGVIAGFVAVRAVRFAARRYRAP